MTALLIAAALAAGLAALLLDSPVVLDTVSWGLIFGVVTPLLTAIVQQPRWSNRRRALVGAVVSVLVGVLTCLANGDIDSGQTVLATIAAVLVASVSTYKGLWKPSGVAPTFEAATSLRTRSGDGDARHVA